MTRINADLNPTILADQHLLAEYNEFGMFYSSLRRSINSLGGIKSIPPKFTLNKGHVSFFYNKLSFMESRYERLKEELKLRGVNLDPDRVISKQNEFPKYLYNDWKSDSLDRTIIKDRIKLRLRQKPNFYRYYRHNINVDEFIGRFYEV